MNTTLTIIAFADDVCGLNANLADIGLPLAAKPLAPRTNLYAHEAIFTTEGYAKLANASRVGTFSRTHTAR